MNKRHLLPLLVAALAAPLIAYKALTTPLEPINEGAFRALKMLGPDAEPPVRAKIIAGTSLSMWVAVLICGRLLTFYRPPFFH